MRASGTEVPDPKVALADLRGTGNFRCLRCAIKGIVAIRKRKYYVLCLDNERKAGGRGLATGIRARDIKGGNARLGRNTREHQAARSTGELEPVGELRLIPCVLVRSLAARGPGNRCEVRAVGARCRQQVAVKHKGVPRHDGGGDTITVRLPLSIKVALSNAAEILAGLLVIEVRE